MPEGQLLAMEQIESYHATYDNADTPEGADVRRLLAHCAAQTRMIKGLSQAMEPFANFQPPGYSMRPTEDQVLYSTCMPDGAGGEKVTDLTRGDFTRARSVLADTMAQTRAD